MYTYKDGLLQIIEVEDSDELKKIDTYFDICIINKWNEGLIKYPTKITHSINLESNFEEYLQTFTQKKRYNLKRLHKIIKEKIDLNISQSINLKQYTLWLEAYNNFIKIMEYGDNRINPSWYKEKAKDHIIFEYFKKNSNQLVGGTLIKVLKTKLSMSYGWANKEFRDIGLATFELYELIRYSFSHDFKKVSFGQDNNLYGGHLSLGLHYFKRYWNTLPEVTKLSEIKGLVYNEKSINSFEFYSIDEENNLVLNRVNNDNIQSK